MRSQKYVKQQHNTLKVAHCVNIPKDLGLTQ